jgi:hypothetical protein
MFSLRMMLRVRTRALAARNPGGFACTSRCSPGRRPLSSRTTAALKAAVLFFRAFFVDYCADLRRQQRELRQAVPRSLYAVRRQRRALFEHHPSRRRRAANNASYWSDPDIRDARKTGSLPGSHTAEKPPPQKSAPYGIRRILNLSTLQTALWGSAHLKYN